MIVCFFNAIWFPTSRIHLLWTGGLALFVAWVLYGAALHHAQVDKEPKPVAPYRIPADLMAHSKHLHRTTCLNTGSHGPHYETASTGVLKGRTIYCNGRDEKLAMVNILPCQYADV